MDMLHQGIFIGASAGGVEALKEVISQLPRDLPAPVFVVLHVSPYLFSSLPRILGKVSTLPALHPEDGTKIKPGFIYIAPPDHHLLVDKGYLLIKKGPKENRFRPSIDALFRSAAYVYGPRAIGVILSGALDDGTSGLWTIKRFGGTAIVQRPGDAVVDSMPRSALEYVDADHILSSTEIGKLLVRLVNEPAKLDVTVEPQLKVRVAKEVQVAADDSAFQKGVMELGTLTPFTCPECHGVLVKIAESKMSRFRCHTGHAFTDNALMEAVTENLGDMLWQVIRSFEECVMLLNHMGQHLEAAGDADRAEVFFLKARELESKSKAFHKPALTLENLSGDNLGQQPKD